MGQQILPFYLVCDESGSMHGEPLEAINEAMPELHSEVGLNPVVADKTQFCIVGFSSDAEVLLPLSDLSQVEELPYLDSKGSTSYRAAFECLKEQIDQDIKRLKSSGHSPYRPVVFFLTDGYPDNENWRDAYERLTSESNPYRPNIVAFGIGQAEPSTISAIATFKAFMAEKDMSPAAALREFATALTKSIVKSGSTPSSDGGMTLQTPDDIPGFTQLTVDAL